MTPEEINAFLDLPFTGALATLRKDGSPQVVPVWYRWTGSEVKVWSDSSFPWVKRLAGEPRVAFTVFEHGVPSRAVYIRGIASIVQGPLPELDGEIRPITARYIAADRLDSLLEEYTSGHDKVVITIRPESVRGIVN